MGAEHAISRTHKPLSSREELILGRRGESVGNGMELKTEMGILLPLLLLLLLLDHSAKQLANIVGSDRLSSARSPYVSVEKADAGKLLHTIQ